MAEIRLGAAWWQSYIGTVFLREIDMYGRVLIGRFLPTITDEEITKMSDDVEQAEWNRIGSLPGPEEYDESQAVEEAFGAGLEEYQYLHSIRQGIINVFGAGLYHLFEQQLCKLLRSLIYDRDLQLEKMKEVVKKFREVYGLDLEKFPKWREIHTLRLLANCTKHGEGRSCQELREIEPDLFKHPVYSEPEAPPRAFTERPLGGEGLYLTVSGFERKLQAIREFWRWMAERLVELDDAS